MAGEQPVVPEDATLDSFGVAEEDGEPDGENEPEAGGERGEDSGTDEASAVSTSGERSGDQSPATEPAAVTSSWGTKGACEACEAAVSRRWTDGDELVCADCKQWK